MQKHTIVDTTRTHALNGVNMTARTAKYIQGQLIRPDRGQTVLHRDTTDWRRRIRDSMAQIIPRLSRCASGKLDMTPTQVKAAQVLLSKVLPDLTSADITLNDPADGKTAEQLIVMLQTALLQADASVRAHILAALGDH